MKKKKLNESSLLLLAATLCELVLHMWKRVWNQHVTAHLTLKTHLQHTD